MQLIAKIFGKYMVLNHKWSVLKIIKGIASQMLRVQAKIHLGKSFYFQWRGWKFLQNDRFLSIYDRPIWAHTFSNRHFSSSELQNSWSKRFLGN